MAESKKRTRSGGKPGKLEVALNLLNEFGIDTGSWGLDVKPQLERMLEWNDYGVPLFVRVFAYLKLATLCYLPGSGGLDPKGAHEGRRFEHCKLHGALLAVTQTSRKLVAIGPYHVRNAINEAAVRSFIKQESREPTPEEKERISETAPDIRRAIDFLERIGMCFRTDHKDVPFFELRKTDEGRKKLKTLSGDNKIRIYLYLNPRESQVRQGRHECLPSQEEANEFKHLYRVFLGLKLDKGELVRLKPLYRAVLDLRLDLEPEAFVGDLDLQEAVRVQVESREALLAQADERLRSAVLAKYPSAQSSTAPNSNGTERAPTSANASERGAVDSSSAVPGKGRALVNPPLSKDTSSQGTADPPLASQPRKPKTTLELAPVDSAMRAECSPSTADVKQLFGACRDEAPDCTPEEVAFWIHRVIQKATKGVNNWVGYLLKAVPPYFQAPAFAAWRVEQQGFEAMERKPVKQEGYAERKAREILEQRKSEAAHG